jgi:hypothetical protein
MEICEQCNATSGVALFTDLLNIVALHCSQIYSIFYCCFSYFLSLSSSFSSLSFTFFHLPLQSFQEVQASSLSLARGLEISTVTIIGSSGCYTSLFEGIKLWHKTELLLKRKTTMRLGVSFSLCVCGMGLWETEMLGWS